MERVTAPEAPATTSRAGTVASAIAPPCDYADRLREAADLLQAQGANPYRVAAYRKAADAITGLDHAAIVDLVDREGIDGLDRLPHVGRGIATAIVEMVRTGHWTQLERLRGTADPVQLFTVVPGLGHRLAERIHEELHVDTLEALELAAHDGRLENVPGVGPRRAAAIRASLHAMLVRNRGRNAPAVGEGPHPSAKLLLAIDRLYREQAALNALPTIAPIRFNPTHEAWLPVLHCEREGWQFTAMYSNTAQAHQLNRTRDWVRIFHYDSENSEGQHTVVTETHGALAGKRVVRGREAECRALYV
ncbi:MAG TPA: helix-hairpin-helix domain-containing protein [Steroidobacteraceae bacterium]|nr:helix-hairpin-helix domain-containing protein [Steroidobacteraceae bacterium]